MPRMDIAALRAQAPPSVRWVPRFIADDEIAAYFERADVVVLPYREIDQSGVLFTALAFGAPLLLSDVGGFGEVAEHGAAALVRPGDAGSLAAGLGSMLGDPGKRAGLAAAARRAAAGPYSWDEIARRQLELYARLARR
jgi:glycosyltransferase involved in cell wall biosynthesis